MNILDDMEVSKLSAKVFSKVNYSFKLRCPFTVKQTILHDNPKLPIIEVFFK